MGKSYLDILLIVITGIERLLTLIKSINNNNYFSHIVDNIIFGIRIPDYPSHDWNHISETV